MILDKDSVKKIQAVDTQFIDEVLSKEIPIVYNFAYRLTRREKEADELAKSSLAQLFRELKTTRSGLNLTHRLIATTILLWKEKQKNAKRSPHKPHRGGGGGTEESYSSQQRHLLNVMERLTPDEKIILILADAEGNSYEEISGMLKTSPSALRTRLSRARDRLRALSEQLGGVA